VGQRLAWVTEQGETWFDETRSFAVTVSEAEGAWTLAFATRFVNVGDTEIVIGSPTTEGRDNAGYGGLFWRGPRSFTGGTVCVPERAGGDELMGVRAPWLAFVGRHDGNDASSTLIFTDDPGNPDHPTRWFVRSTPFAAVCPAPFFDRRVPVAPGAALALRYTVTIADGARDPSDAARLANTTPHPLPPLPR
jgi:hypothetical protein